MDEAKSFANFYLLENQNYKILDVGSYDVNGSMRPVFEPYGEYIGLDIEEGNNVDLVGDLYNFPLEDNSVDIIVSSSCFEHAKLFWVTFNEMVRVLKTGGLIYINTPSRGSYHGYPVDCWRFYKDSYAALAEWNKDVQLLDQHFNNKGAWGDNIGVFEKIN